MDRAVLRDRMLRALFAPQNLRVIGMTRDNSGAGFQETLEASKARAARVVELLYVEPPDDATEEADHALHGS
ncbi:MAG: hypothetical protein AB1505_02040 [Candidatus Latescibacterota bacterium]